MEMGTVIHQAPAPGTIPFEVKPGTTSPVAEIKKQKCPSCDCDAVYKYGKAWTGKQRFLCKMCGKQFTESLRRVTVKGNPLCPQCGSHMNLYRTQGNIIRFRCSHYPACRTFKKYRVEAEGDD
jgi:transposase-like protein